MRSANRLPAELIQSAEGLVHVADHRDAMRGADLTAPRATARRTLEARCAITTRKPVEPDAGPRPLEGGRPARLAGQGG